MSEKYKPNPEAKLSEPLSTRNFDSVETEFSHFQPAPEGWLNANDFGKLKGKSWTYTKSILNEFVTDHPDQVRTYLGPQGRPRQYYSPELVSKFREKLEEYEAAPSGWQIATQVARALGRSFTTVSKLAEPYKQQHPEWFKKYATNKGSLTLHYGPELIKLMNNELNKHKSAPAGWMNAYQIAEEVGRSVPLVSKIAGKLTSQDDPRVGIFLGSKNVLGTYYSPELTLLIKERCGGFERPPKGWLNINQISKKLNKAHGIVQKLVEEFTDKNHDLKATYLTHGGQVRPHFAPEVIQRIEEKLGEIKIAPEGWRPIRALVPIIGRDYTTIKTMAQQYLKDHTEWSEMYQNSENFQISEHYSPELIELLAREFSKFKEAPPGWLTLRQLKQGLDRGSEFTKEVAEEFLKNNPEWKGTYLDSSNNIRTHYHPELAERLRERVASLKQPPDGWKNGYNIAKSLNKSHKTIQGLAKDYVSKHPDSAGIYLDKINRPSTYYAPQFQEYLEKEFSKKSSAPAGWMTLRGLEQIIPHDRDTIKKLLDRNSGAEDTANYIDAQGRLRIHYSPKVIETVKQQLEVVRQERQGLQQGWELKQELQSLVTAFAKEATPEHEQLEKLLNLFGNSNIVDILFKFNPQFKKLPIGYVKSMLADYLGNFLGASPPLNLNNLIGQEVFLEDESFQEYLYEIIKNDVLSYSSKQKKSAEDPKQLVFNYLENLKHKSSEVQNFNFSAIMRKVESYYNSIFEELHKPHNLIESLEAHRSFPEFYQLINIKELVDKKKILLADEMGVGKSASAILTKEYLRLKSALIVVPSNIVNTWLTYLSDKTNESGKQIGYFKKGQSPRVLVVEDLASLQHNIANYDYVLLSQERLNEAYTQALAGMSFDMIIVDEIHKLKNIGSGIRAANIIELAKSIKGENQYLALLSGTPVPNKVEDLAIILKLLYPEEFAHVRNNDLVRRIIYSDVIDLRSKLLPRMQMKSLAESVEMPKLQENIIATELSDLEKTIYETLLEEDEIEAPDKMRILRQFLLNPELLDATPNIESSKIKAVREALRRDFKNHKKVIMFVNGYINNVIKGDKNIIDQLQLPSDVSVRVIHGEVSKKERATAQEELRTSDKKMLLLVSGQTADVGVDFSAGEKVNFYNEPWTKYEQRQELGRVYRPGLVQNLESDVFITKDTIEEGIHLYIQAKEQAIEKLLRGIPRSEIENRLLDESEKQTDPNLEVNPELARYYFSDWDKMAKIFAYIKEIGEKNFMQFLAEFGKDYATCYLNLGNRSYQANADRVSGTIIDELVKKSGQNAQEIKMLDIASGPEMLKRHMTSDYNNSIISMDINKEHFQSAGGKRAVASFTNIPFKSESMDYANFALALHYTQFVPSRNNYERLEALLELNRVLKVRGKAVINMIYSLDFKDENKFRNVLTKIGFKVSDEYSGEVAGGRNYKSKVFTLEKINSHEQSLTEAVHAIGKDTLEGLKLLANNTSLKDSRKIIEEFNIAGKHMEVNFNEEDKRVLAEEQEITNLGEKLKIRYGSIQDISREDVISNGLTRILVKDKYILFKRLKSGEGVVVIK